MGFVYSLLSERPSQRKQPQFPPTHATAWMRTKCGAYATADPSKQNSLALDD
jgi:hypothetical protein